MLVRPKRYIIMRNPDCGLRRLFADICCGAEVDKAAAGTEQPYDGTGGRGADGHITNALKQEHK